MSVMTLRQAAGEVLLVGLEGTELSAVETAWLRLLRPGGVILFRRNVESATQVHALLRATGQVIDHPLLSCIDVEGGTVDRLRDLIAPMPSPFAVAATNQPALFEKHGSLIGQEVRMLGLNTTLAPVLDLRTIASEGVMTTRVVSGDPDQITRYAKHFLRGLLQHRVLGNGKHFPGLGSGQVDSHHATPLITKPFDLLWQEDIVPYRRLARQLPMVTVSHAAYSAADEEPASISNYWINKVLVRQIGYKGLILSDDMEMGGILKHTGIAEASVRALHAGIHGLEICRDPGLIFAAYEAILREAETSPSFARLLRRAATKVWAVAAALPRKLPPSPTLAAVERMRTAVERFTEKIKVEQA